MSSLLDERSGVPANNRCMAAVMARRSFSSGIVGLLAVGRAGPLMLLDEFV
ncbi:hypothetical protein R4P64_30455 [Rhodococcus sp. IEGM 1366]|uniref:hypothetical protein n=1 Tax=Rhodococcus sp. IEGM 1366 TaxID=3082223 RepID=UPI002955BB26|nr:hypothetical protein [Rhodococcus sp. IEGM 1366]MDV8070849.1 hypothetical protein [Rhodococcus sp. IEGM 1366]